jgi:hypothetical protein
MKELKNIYIESTNKTPQIDFNGITGDLIISGRSIPENATKIYQPLFEWLSEYIHKPSQTTNLRLQLDYFNTSSSIWLAKLVKTLCQIKNPESVLLIHLYFDVEDYDNMDPEDIQETLSLVVDNISSTVISIGVKIYGTDDKGTIIKESMILI